MESGLLVAHLGRGDVAGLERIRAVFGERNPGYDVRFERGGVESEDATRVVFVQRETAEATVAGASSIVDVGDIVLLRPGESMTGAGLDLVVFTTPEPLPDGLPSFIRPDWDDRITDTPGGCATETGAYRRILLTWLESNGPYVYHALNAHRVRIMDSFSHYHPIDGGFDEFYLVQMAMPNARVIISHRVDRIEDPGSVARAEAGTLLETHHLEVGDLVYMPRGMMHRGIDGVLAQVITAPGFRPGGEIGVDHHLRAINERLELSGADALPYHEAASLEAVVK